MCSRPICSCLAVALLAVPACLAQDAASGQGNGSAKQPVYTFHTGTRVVLTDVTVLDSAGKPVTGLPRSAFGIFDDGSPQSLTAFEEHHGPQPEGLSVTPDAPSGRHLFSNAYFAHPPAASNILFIDNTDLGFGDQALLAKELSAFIKSLPAGEALAVYGRDGLSPVELQSFTADHALLLAAVAKAVPHLRQTEAQFASDKGALLTLVDMLAGLPGRKNLLWFSAGPQVGLTPDPETMPIGEDLKPVYDALEAARIAVYPVDARGLTVMQTGSERFQHLEMENTAEATGGRAFFNENDMTLVAQRALRTGNSFYTLSYSPHDLRVDNKWHRVRVEVAGKGYTLSYRRGYFDDGNDLTSPPDHGRALLRAGGLKTELSAARETPIIFQARVEPEAEATSEITSTPQTAPPTPAPGRGEVTYAVHYRVPASAFSVRSVDGKPQTVIGTGIVAMNRFGRPVDHLSRAVTVTLDPVKLAAHPEGFISFDQQINLPSGQDYLEVAVWDSATGRSGSIHVPLEVSRKPE